MINPGDGSINTPGEAPEGYQLNELRWSPDGTGVIATGNSTAGKRLQQNEYWVLENFLPK
jgi:hypothetical protein